MRICAAPMSARHRNWRKVHLTLITDDVNAPLVFNFVCTLQNLNAIIRRCNEKRSNAGSSTA